MKTTWLIIVLLMSLCSIAAIAEETSKIWMSDLTAGDEILVTNDNEEMIPAVFHSLCYVPGPDGLESVALIDFTDKTKSGHYANTLTEANEPIHSIKFITGSVCTNDGRRGYLIQKSQLLGVLTQLDNMMSADSIDKSLRAFADLYTRKDEVRSELAEIRRVILN